ncbi:MAG: alpha-2,8-polysialyltransferase family protein [Lachnospiraceae bacterium]|nr:alpha-2,8-polysialyltransferase family protein [Lachnospiraceae bacterium]
MNHTNITNIFLNIEEAFNLNSLNINGYYPWIYNRFSLWQSINNPAKKLSLPNKKKTGGLLHDIISAVKSNSKKKKLSKSKCDILFLCHSRRILNNDFYECLYTDALADIFPDSITLETPYKSNTHFSPAKTKELLYTDQINLKSRTYAYLIKHLSRRKYDDIKNQIEAIIKDPLKQLNDMANSDINIDYWVNIMTNRYFVYVSRLKAYRKLIRKISPKIIIEVVSYTIDKMIINEVAKEENITTAELQHGIIDKYHIAYNYPIGNQIKQFPDKLFLFADFFKDKASYPIDRNNLISVGFPFFEKQLKHFSHIFKKETDINILVFLSQPGITQGIKFDDLAVEMSKRLMLQGWKVIFKLHPGELNDWKQRYPILAGSAVEVIDDPNRTLYEIFSISTAVIGISTTAIYEGLGFGLSAFIFNASESDRMGDLCELGYCHKVNNSDELFDAVKNINCDDKVHLRNIFFKDNALNNMEENIRELLV